MRNLKKILALVLAMVMTFSVMATANAALTDLDEVGATYEEAVTVLTGMGVFKGRTAADGSTYFAPKGTITREEVATIIYRIASGDVTDAQKALYVEGADFTDVKATDWAAGYIGYAANGGLVNGYGNGEFGPKDEVTGVQVLAMILRAVGYDANDEFTGADWDDRVMSTAQSLGILKNVKAATLVAPASRELVAELLFRTIATVDQVEHTPALGYQPVKIWFAQTATIGEEKFNLVKSDYEDAWGRPGYKWTYNVGDKSSTFMDTPVYENTVKVDECEIAHAIGLTKSAAIEKAYIDGDVYAITDAAVTSNQYGTINPLATTSYVGAQGRILEIYDMGTAGYRIVEINTYLGQVEKVTPAYVDKNGHVVAATIEVDVYEAGTMNDTAGWDFNGIKAEGYSVNDYVLVTVLNPKEYADGDAAVKSVKAAPIVAGGSLAGWTSAYADVAATHTVGATSYKDADKFELNYRDNTKVWNVATDNYGNIIGLIETATNYLVVEKVEWKHNASGFGGYALADVVLADGSKVAGVTVTTVNSYPISNVGDQAGNRTGIAPNVSDSFVNNGGDNGYYNHIWTYSINADGSYNLAWIDHSNTANTTKVIDLLTNATYNNGTATINSQTNTLVATDNTVFLYKNLVNDGYTYTTYVGKNNAPSITGATMCVKYDTYGYAELVVVSDYDLATNSFVAYVTSNNNIGTDSLLGTVYNVYKLGETTPTMVYAKAGVGTWGYDTTHETGLYNITVNNNNQITAMSAHTCDLHCETEFVNAYGTTLDRSMVVAPVSGNSFQTAGYSAVSNSSNGFVATTDNTAVKDYNVTDATKVIKVLKTAKTGVAASLVEGTLADITAGSVVIVDYTTVGSKHHADVVYVMVKASTGINPGETTYAVTHLNNTTVGVRFSSAGDAVVVDNAKIVKNGANYAYGTANVKVVIKDAATGIELGTVNSTVSGAGTAGNCEAKIRVPVSLTDGNYKVTITVSNSTIGTLTICTDTLIGK